MNQYPNTFYRVSVKALIKDNQGRVLVLKENQDTWSLPGGGLDHGEDPVMGVQRELTEELGLNTYGPVLPLCVKTFYLESRQSWLLWVVFSAQVQESTFTLGQGVTAATFLDPAELRASNDIFEQLVYEVSQSA